MNTPMRVLVAEDEFIIGHDLCDTVQEAGYIVEGHARIDYVAPGEFLRFYLEGTYDEVDSNFDFVDYVDVRVMLGAIIRY